MTSASGIAAMILSSPPQFGQFSRSRSKTRLSSRAQLLQETSHLPHLAMRLFDGQLCITQRFLYGARPFPELIAFAQALADEAQRLGAARGHAFGITLRGEAELLAGDLPSAEQHLRLGARLHRAIGGATGEAFSLQRLAEVALHCGRHDDAHAALDDALDVALQTDIGFHLLDRIYGTRIALAQSAGSPAAALHALEDAREAVRGHPAVARGEGADVAASKFAQAALRFRGAGQPLDGARCERLTESSRRQ